MSALPTDVRKEDKNFIAKLNAAVNVLRNDLDIWLNLKDLPHEEWLDVIGYEKLYQISNYGRVKSFHNGKIAIRKLIRKPVVIKDVYIQVSLDKNHVRKCMNLHVLVALNFIPNPENRPLVNHEDNNPANNCIWNLNWATNGENQKHAVKIGTKKIGCANPRAKLTANNVRYIRANYIPKNKEFGAVALSKKFGIGLSTFKRIITGKSYQDVD